MEAGLSQNQKLSKFDRSKIPDLYAELMKAEEFARKAEEPHRLSVSLSLIAIEANLTLSGLDRHAKHKGRRH